MRTLRLVERRATPQPPSGDLDTADRPVPTPAPAAVRPGEVSIRIATLPTPLRATVRDQPAGSITIEAELPWLAIGTVVHAGAPDGTERSGRVRAFAVDVTSSGAARLLIRAALEGAGAATAELPARRRPRNRSRRPSLALVALLVVAAAITGAVVGRLSARSLPGGSAALPGSTA